MGSCVQHPTTYIRGYSRAASLIWNCTLVAINWTSGRNMKLSLSHLHSRYFTTTKLWRVLRKTPVICETQKMYAHIFPYCPTIIIFVLVLVPSLRPHQSIKNNHYNITKINYVHIYWIKMLYAAAICHKHGGESISVSHCNVQSDNQTNRDIMTDEYPCSWFGNWSISFGYYWITEQHMYFVRPGYV